MGNKIYINGIGGISAQPEDALFIEKIAHYHQNIIPAIAPNFKQHIPAMQLRRMSGGIKMGLTSAKIAMEEAGIEMPDAIITGTGEGCKQDTEKFLLEMLEQQEEMLSPTSFIQSTHNTIGGQIALHIKCTNYNMTYSQNSASLESALMDAGLLLKENSSIKTVLVGGVDEISEKITGFQELDGQIKDKTTSNMELFEADSPGTIISEGAHFFSLASEKMGTTYAVLQDVEIFQAKKGEDVSIKILEFLEKNEIELNELQCILLGRNGDNRFDHFYTHIQKGIFSKVSQLAWKHLSGDYDTSSGFALRLGGQILKNHYIPKILKLNDITPGATGPILIYNQYLGENHSLILLTSP